MIDGGQVPLPGEVSRAHHGTLFLDTRPTCRRHVLEVLRQPLEEGVTILAGALTAVHENRSCFNEAELHGLRGEFLLRQAGGKDDPLVGPAT